MMFAQRIILSEHWLGCSLYHLFCSICESITSLELLLEFRLTNAPVKCRLQKETAVSVSMLWVEFHDGSALVVNYYFCALVSRLLIYFVPLVMTRITFCQRVSPFWLALKRIDQSIVYWHRVHAVNWTAGVIGFRVKLNQLRYKFVQPSESSYVLRRYFWKTNWCFWLLSFLWWQLMLKKVQRLFNLCLLSLLCLVKRTTEIVIL